MYALYAKLIYLIGFYIMSHNDLMPLCDLHWDFRYSICILVIDFIVIATSLWFERSSL